MAEGDMGNLTIPFRAGTNQSLATNLDISLVEGSRVISHFHFSLKKKPKASALSHTALDWPQYASLAAKKFCSVVVTKIHIGQRIPSSSCSWRCLAGRCQSIGFPCSRSTLGPRPGSLTSCRRSCLQVSQTQPESDNEGEKVFFWPVMWVF